MRKYLKFIFLTVFVLEVLLRIVDIKENRIIRQTDYFMYLNAIKGEDYIKKAMDVGIKPFGKPNKKYKLRNHIPPYNYFYVTYNNFGFRGPNITLKKPKDTYRIFVMGDSTVVGWGVEDNETLSANLQRVLDKKILNKKIEVINAGSPGAKLSDGISFMKDIVKYQPDIIIANYLENDIAFHGVMSAKRKIGKLSIKVTYYLGYSEIFLTFRTLMNYLLIKQGFIGSKALLETNTPYSPENYRRKLNTFYDICKGNNIQLIYINIPICLKLDHLFYKSLKDLRKHYKSIIKDVSKKNDFSYIELEDDFRAHSASEDELFEFKNKSNWIEYFPFKETPFLIEKYYPLFVDVSHPNNAGFRLIASRLCKEIEKKIPGIITGKTI